jgi:hypothetical protein
MLWRERNSRPSAGRLYYPVSSDLGTDRYSRLVAEAARLKVSAIIDAELCH